MKNLRTGLKDLVPSRIPVWYAALSASHGYLYSLRYLQCFGMQQINACRYPSQDLGSV